MKRLLALACASVLASAAGAQTTFKTLSDDAWCREGRGGRDWRRARWCEVREATTPAPSGVLSVNASPNGGVSAKGWDRSDVRVRVKVEARAETEAEARELVAQVTIAGGPEWHSEGPRTRGEAYWSASFELSVPTRSDLTLTSVNGPVAVADVEGRLQLDTQNGPLSVSRAGGSVRGRTSNGPVHVELSGASWNGEGLDAETVNGPIELEVPQDFNAELDAGTTNGPISLGFPVMVKGRLNKSVRVTLGSGGPPVRVRTTNGPVRLERP